MLVTPPANPSTYARVKNRACTSSLLAGHPGAVHRGSLDDVSPTSVHTSGLLTPSPASSVRSAAALSASVAKCGFCG